MVKDLRVLKLRLDLGNDALGELLLLALLDLALVADPGVEHVLGLVGKSGLLLHLVSLSLELGGLLQYLLASELRSWHAAAPSGELGTCLGNSKEVLCDVNHTTEVLDVVDPALDGIGVVLPRRVQDVLDLVRVAVAEVLVHGPDIVVDSPVDGQKREKNDGLLVDDVDLVADGRDGDTGAGGEQADLAGQAVAGQGIEDRVRGVLGIFLRDAGGGLLVGAAGGGSVEGGGEGGRGRADREGWAGSGGACGGSVCSMGAWMVLARAGVLIALRAMREAMAVDVVVVRGDGRGNAVRSSSRWVEALRGERCQDPMLSRECPTRS